MALSKTALIDLYRKRAPWYDLSANLYYLIGFREAHYRKCAVASLRLKPGDTVVEIGCGTGLNFPYLVSAVGPSGKVIGVDLNDAMLEQAQDRIDRHAWRNVNLVKQDAAQFAIPEGVNGVISTFAITLIPEFNDIIRHAHHALVRGGRLVILDFKKPEHWPLWLVKFGVWITSPFGVTLDLTDRKPWLKMQTQFDQVRMQAFFGGSVYIATGEKR